MQQSVYRLHALLRRTFSLATMLHSRRHVSHNCTKPRELAFYADGASISSPTICVTCIIRGNRRPFPLLLASTGVLTSGGTVSPLARSLPEVYSFSGYPFTPRGHAIRSARRRPGSMAPATRRSQCGKWRRKPRRPSGPASRAGPGSHVQPGTQPSGLPYLRTLPVVRFRRLRARRASAARPSSARGLYYTIYYYTILYYSKQYNAMQYNAIQ